MENFGFAIVMANTTMPFILKGVYSDGALYFQDEIRLPVGKNEIINELRRLRIDKQAKKGLKVIVSEISPDISKALGVHHRIINDRSVNGEPIVNLSIPRLEELQSSNAILVDEESGLSLNAYIINNGIYESEYNANGDLYYRIDWNSVTDKMKAALLAVYSTTYHAVDSGAYLKEVGAILDPQPDVTDPYQQILEAIQVNENNNVSELRQRGCTSLAGTKYKGDRNGRVL